MPSKKKKYNARFPAGRIKKIMQSDEEIGKVAQAVPVIISRTLELFVESLLTKTLRITNSRNAKTLSPSHMRQCIVSEKRFDFLKELVRNIPDISVAEEAAYNEDDMLRSSPEDQYPDSDTPYDLSLPSTSMRSQSNNGTASTAAYMRSMSLNGGGGAGTKRQQQQLPPHLNPTHTLPAKLARSESTPAYTPGQRGRPPNSHSQHHKKQPVQLDTAIPAPICSYELNKPIVKIDYSNVQMRSLCTPEAAVSAPATNSGAAFNFDIAAPVINIDLTNIVAAGAGVGAASSRPTSIGFAPADNNNVNQMAGKSSAPIIPKATAAPSATPTETIFELDEDYDNI
ncbi:dr1-associated corepressor homolog [Drosophila kikkawai]|uniref:Dr1-associated corepressor homolog n=1 Tax=Drosophila kikkawai TaxID=30033 RepID=A0A6P4I8K8_DROKI|nr:dr1-associated corepressor homolog [Drosophila kikkawai]KAH8308939.1 hypothetical protein KR059_003650 [Drosophila kikkawai]